MTMSRTKTSSTSSIPISFLSLPSILSTLFFLSLFLSSLPFTIIASSQQAASSAASKTTTTSSIRGSSSGKFSSVQQTHISTKRVNVVHNNVKKDELLAIEPEEAVGPTVIPTIAPTTLAILPPPNCINTDDDLVYVNGFLSATQTISKCINNIADPFNIPTFYRGTFNGVMQLYANIQVNNLHNVS